MDKYIGHSEHTLTIPTYWVWLCSFIHLFFLKIRYKVQLENKRREVERTFERPQFIETHLLNYQRESYCCYWNGVRALRWPSIKDRRSVKVAKVTLPLGMVLFYQTFAPIASRLLLNHVHYEATLLWPASLHRFQRPQRILYRTPCDHMTSVGTVTVVDLRRPVILLLAIFSHFGKALKDPYIHYRMYSWLSQRRRATTNRMLSLA